MSLIIPNTFATKTGAIQLSLLDENFTEVKTKVDPYLDNISVNTGTGEVTIDGGIIADVTGNVTGGISGNAGTVTNGVYTIGDQTIGGSKTFSSPILGNVTGNVTGNISGTATLSGSSTLTSGATLSSTNMGSIYAPGMGIQTVYKRVDALTTYTIPTPGVSPFAGVYISDQSTIITPKYSNSAVYIQWNPTFECIYDVVFRLFRSVGGVDTEIGRNAVAAAGAWVGWAMPGYDADNNTTARTNHHIYLDFPATTNAVTYKFMITQSTTGAAAATFYQNRPIRSAGASTDEIGISQVILQEIAQ